MVQRPRALQHLFLSGVLPLFLMGCAGPMSPFGPINSWSLRWPAFEFLDAAVTMSPRSQVQFSPPRQVLHTAVPFQIIIEDRDGVPDSFRLELSYNGIDVGESFTARAERHFLDSARTRLRLSLANLRLLPGRENQIRITYRRHPEAPPVIARYEPPRCSAFETARDIASVPQFDPSPLVLEIINHQSRARQFNPYFLAGLIAQESGFDPRAVSRSRAIGLTQVTPLGAAEVAKTYSTWPRYPGIDELSFPELRFLVLRGKINAANEWRLNPLLSIQGGIEYLAYLNDYWNRPEKRRLIEYRLGSSDNVFSEIMLASYNSGTFRVAAALESRGREYLKDEELNEARRYVNQVVSYCDYFANAEE